MRRYNWCKSGELLKHLLDEGVHVICIDNEDCLCYAYKLNDNEYIIGGRHIFPNGSNAINGYPFIEPEEYMPSEVSLPRQKDCKGQYAKLNETQQLLAF